MIDHLVGRPNPSWKRAQVFLVILFWLWRILRGNSGPPRILWFPRINRALKRFTPWQIIVSSLTAVYTIKNFDTILGLSAPEPLARLYSPSYYRATWVTTGLDAGFATAIPIRPKWLRDLCSIIFSAYYIIYANEADEKLRRFRAVPTVEMLRCTWEKTTNPYIRLVTRIPKISIRRKILLPRPKASSYDRPIAAYLFFAPPEDQLPQATELILDYPGGGFVAMTPEHHEERLTMWAIKTGRPVLAIDYGKAPEYPYPFASDEVFDCYRVLVETNGAQIGMSGKKLSIIVSGDSAGATMAVNAVVKVLEHNQLCMSTHQGSVLSLPTALVLNYAALDFNFTSWMSGDNLRVLRSEQSSGTLPVLQELAAQKDHLRHVSPLSMVTDKKFPSRKRLKRRASWKDTLRGFTSGGEKGEELPGSQKSSTPSAGSSSVRVPTRRRTFHADDKGELADGESEDDEDYNSMREEDRPLQARVRYSYGHSDSRVGNLPRSESEMEQQQRELLAAVAEADTKAIQATASKGRGEHKEPIGTRLTMTSRTGHFQDRIISPSMMRAMAILYIGPHRNPDFATDYHISPILTPALLLAQFPPVLMQCGEKDPFVDDTVIFAGRLREAKRARKVELDLALSGKSARFGEGLRMSSIEASSDSRRMADLKRERDKLASESESDWVQMVLFSDWSHGYLQMPTLMSEAKAVIEELGEWIDDAFKRYKEHTSSEDSNSSGRMGRERMAPRERPGMPSLPVPQPSTKTQVPSPLTSETETEPDSAIIFVPKKYQDEKRRGSFGSNGSHGRGPGGAKPVVDLASTRGHFSSSDSTLLDERTSTESPSQLSDLGARDGPTAEERGDILVSADKSVAGIESGAQTSDAGQKPSAPRGAGLTISETELMRRRRLLDAHIFD